MTFSATSTAFSKQFCKSVNSSAEPLTPPTPRRGEEKKGHKKGRAFRASSGQRWGPPRAVGSLSNSALRQRRPFVPHLAAGYAPHRTGRIHAAVANKIAAGEEENAHCPMACDRRHRRRFGPWRPWPRRTIRTITLVVPIAAGGGIDTIADLPAGSQTAQAALGGREPPRRRRRCRHRVGRQGAARWPHLAAHRDVGCIAKVAAPRHVAFDVVADFAPVAQIATAPLFLFANSSTPWQTSRS